MEFPLTAARFELLLQARSRITLREFAGATIRGGFGDGLRAVACPACGTECAACGLRDSCTYTRLFKTPIGAHPGPPSGLRTPPRPLILEPPRGPLDLAPGQTFSVGVVLIGSSIGCVAQVVAGFERLGQVGLGASMGCFSIVGIQGSAPSAPTGAGGPALLPCSLSAARPLVWEDFEQRASQLVAGAPATEVLDLLVTFETPTRIEERDDLVVNLEFPSLARAAKSRLEMLSRFHCGGLTRWPREFLDPAQDVRVIDRRLRWSDHERFSTHQQTRSYCGGFVGHVHFRGPLGRYLPLLAATEVVHVGKDTMFGHGRLSLAIACAARERRPSLSGPARPEHAAAT